MTTRALSMEEFAEKMRKRGLTVDGREIPDNKPMAPPVGYVKQPSMFEQMRSMVAAELAMRRANEEVDSPQDIADMGDDEEEAIERLSQYERYDLEMELARRTDAEAATAAAAAKEPGAAPAGQGEPKAPAEGGEALDAPSAPAKAV